MRRSRGRKSWGSCPFALRWNTPSKWPTPVRGCSCTGLTGSFCACTTESSRTRPPISISSGFSTGTWKRSPRAGNKYESIRAENCTTWNCPSTGTSMAPGPSPRIALSWIRTNGRYGSKCPQEILALKDRSGIMRPMGPILYGEADTRLCHEFLSLERRRIGRDPVELPAVKDALCEYLSFTEEKLSGWYGLKICGRGGGSIQGRNPSKV